MFYQLSRKMVSFSFFFLLFLCSAQKGFSVENPTLPNLSYIKDPAELLNNEIERLDTLIQATQQSLENQKALRASIVEYQKIQNLYLQNTQDNELLFHLIKNAHYLLESIKENHLLHTFDSDFLSELTLLSQAANKRGMPKP
jgi:hypothetical protein